MNAFIPLFAWLTIAIFFAYQYIFRVMPGIIMNNIMESFNIDANQFGSFNAIYYAGYVIAHIPLGIAMDKYKIKNVILSCMLLTAAGSLPLIYFDSWILVLIGRFLVGFGSAGAIIGAFTVVKKGFDDSKFGLLIGLTVTIGIIGAIFGGMPLIILIDSIGYHKTILNLFYIGLFLSIITYIVFMPYERYIIQNQYVKSDSGNIDRSNLLSNIKEFLNNKMFILLGITGGLMVGPIEGFADAWGPVFFEVLYNFNKEQASLVSSLIILGYGIGGPLLGYIGDKTKKYYSIIIFCGIGMSIIFYLFLFNSLEIIFTDNNPNLIIIYIILFILGLFSSYQILVIDKALKLVPAKFIAISSAVINMIIMIFGSLFHKFIGIMMMKVDKNIISNQEYGLSLRDALIIIPSCTIIAVIILIYIAFKEKNNKDNKNISKNNLTF